MLLELERATLRRAGTQRLERFEGAPQRLVEAQEQLDVDGLMTLIRSVSQLTSSTRLENIVAEVRRAESRQRALGNQPIDRVIFGDKDPKPC